jgi:hypothetical protein
MGVGEMMVPSQMEPVGPRIGPNDHVVGAALSRTVFGFEDDKVLRGVGGALSQSARRDQAEKQCRDNDLHHGFALRNARSDIAALAGTNAWLRAASNFRGFELWAGPPHTNR